MGITTKDDKMILLKSEELKSINNKYLANGIDLGKAIFYYREALKPFVELSAGDYTVSIENENTFVTITNSAINEILVSFQIAYELTFSSGEYNPTFEVDVETLLSNHNKLVIQTRDLWEIVKKQAFMNDSMNSIGVMTALDPDQVWVSTSTGWEGMNIRAFEENVRSFWETFDANVLQSKVNLDDYEIIKKSGIDTYIENVTKPNIDAYVEQTTKPNLKTYGEAQVDAHIVAVTKPDLVVYKNGLKQELDDKFNELKKDNGIIPAETTSIHNLAYGRWWTADITQFVDSPTSLATGDESGVLELDQSNGNKLLKFFTASGKILFQIETAPSIYTVWGETGGSTVSVAVIGNLGTDFLFAPIKWGVVEQNYIKATAQSGADSIAVKGNSSEGLAYYDSRVKIPAGATDDEGNIFEDGHYYFLSQTVDGKFQKANPDTGVWQCMFQVMKYDNNLYAMIEISIWEDLTPIVYVGDEPEQIATKGDILTSTPNKNYLINGNFDIWQRGTSITTSSGYVADRWKFEGGVAVPISRQLNASTLFNAKYYHRVLSQGDSINLYQIIENPNNVLYGKKSTLSFYVKANVNSNLIAVLRNGTKDVNIEIKEYDITTSWNKIEIHFDSSTNWDSGDNIVVYLSSDISEVDRFDFAQVKFEVGSVATEFEPKTFAEELRDCQRYFEKSFEYDVVPANGPTLTSFATEVGLLSGASTNVKGWKYNYMTTKRVTPLVIHYGNSDGHFECGDVFGSYNGTHKQNTSGFEVLQQRTSEIAMVRGHYTADAEL